ncbi:hypothetical protein PGTUg99_003942 [Puccinia graminis f. sp. tritici]|uniref:Uncharacterized protein n=1 Tax=Puccinia graminis f. sp. tritici TaxID=56615 RepID=A0A5B0QZX6_PUCGR|nr:hypothetical protein PGTUg99_003942 [Puccinia graminis f. sp. tritici]
MDQSKSDAAKTISNRSRASQIRIVPGTSESDVATQAPAKSRKPRASASEIAENKRIRAENKLRKEEKLAQDRESAKRKREANQIELENLKEFYASKRARTDPHLDPNG